MRSLRTHSCVCRSLVIGTVARLVIRIGKSLRGLLHHDLLLCCCVCAAGGRVGVAKFAVLPQVRETRQ